MVDHAQRAEQLVQNGIAAAREGRHGDAQRSLREAVRLAPDHEHAWLWLSGVEDSDPRKIAALNEVLRINPANAAAWRGLELLNQPKSVDLAAFAPEPPRRAPEPPAMPAPALAAPPPPQAKKVDTGNLAAAPESKDASDLFANLRPALAKGGKRSIWLRPSEMVMLVVLLPLLFGMLAFFRSKLDETIADARPADEATRPGLAPPSQEPAPGAVTVEPAAGATSPPPPPVQAADMIRSQSYGVQVMSVDVDDDNQGLTVHLKLTNLTNRQARYRTTDFSFTNGKKQQLQIDPAISSLIAGQASTVFVIDPGKPRTGSLRLVGAVGDLPITMLWQPTNGGARKEIVVR